MAVRIRLTRMGSRNKPVYRIVASDSRRPRDGQYIEQIGTYNPAIDEVKVNEEVAMKWLNQGALPTDTARSLLSKKGVMAKFAESKKEISNYEFSRINKRNCNKLSN